MQQIVKYRFDNDEAKARENATAGMLEGLMNKQHLMRQIKEDAMQTLVTDKILHSAATMDAMASMPRLDARRMQNEIEYIGLQAQELVTTNDILKRFGGKMKEEEVKKLQAEQNRIQQEIKESIGRVDKMGSEKAKNWTESGANIITISHQRDEEDPGADLIVDIVISHQESILPKLLDSLKEHGITITRVGIERLMCMKTFILIGHILHTDLTDTINQIDRKDIAEVTELHMIMPKVDEPSTAKITIKAEAEMDNVIEKLEAIAAKKNLMIVDEIGGRL